jgi:hypothetical protein
MVKIYANLEQLFAAARPWQQILSGVYLCQRFFRGP